jgi:signal transduction histidine kinase
MKSGNPEYVSNLLSLMKEGYPPIPIRVLDDEISYLYYSDSYLLIKLRNYPFYQLAIIFLFLLVSYFAFRNSQQAEQNKVWVGLAKETAHQLGTPISSLMAWTELLESDQSHANKETFKEMRKDLNRLNTVTERFSKIGSPPILNRANIVEVIGYTIEYMKTRSPRLVYYVFHTRPDEIFVNLNVPLFEWVLENLFKNSLDAMQGGGQIKVTIRQLKDKVVMDVSDTGFGIPKSNFKTVFNPGFTTKKRGWGLGLSLVRRIIRNYHKGQIFVRESLPNEKTTFRIILKAAED